MNNESKTPETIWAWDNTTKMALGYWIDDEPVSKREVTKYYRDDLYAEAVRQNAALRAFVVMILTDGSKIDIYDAADESGVLIEKIASQTDVDVLRDCAIGDEIWGMPDWMLTDAAMEDKNE